jgi:alkylhydroperoxidase family enzyme
MSEPIDELRALAAAAPRTPAVMDSYLGKVRERASTVVDGDVDALKEAGLSEDEIFEHTVTVAIEEGLRRLDRAREVIG